MVFGDDGDATLSQRPVFAILMEHCVLYAIQRYATVSIIHTMAPPAQAVKVIRHGLGLFFNNTVAV